MAVSVPRVCPILLSLVLLCTTAYATDSTFPQVENNYAIVVSTWPFKEAVRAAWNAVQNGLSSVDAVVEGCSACEDLGCDGTGATIFLKSIDASGKTKNAEYLCRIMDEVIKDVGEENVVQIVTDNAANYVAAGKLLMERHPHLFWTPCAAHCIDLMLEDLGKLPWIKTVIERGRSVCKFIYNHTWVLNLMRKHNGQRELSRPGVTRFATNFLTLKSLLDSKGGLRRMFVSEEWLASSYATTTAGIAAADHIFDEPSFWTPIADIVTFVKPLIVLLRIADGEKPSMGYIYEGMDRVKEAIHTFFAGNQDRYGPIWDVIDRRWHNLLHRPIHAAAYFLNPAYQFSPHFKADDEVWSGLYDVVERMSSNSAVSTDIVREIELFKKAQGDLFARELCKKNRTALMPVGAGGSPDENGETTLDAMVMNGVTMEVGAVASMQFVKGAIRAAKLVSEYTRHTLLVGNQASTFALSMGLPGPTNLSSPESLEKWTKWKQNNCEPNFRKNVIPINGCGPYNPVIGACDLQKKYYACDNRNTIGRDSILANAKTGSEHINRHNHDTISMAVIDKLGHIAVGTSTNGATFKIPGRVGDGPIAGSSAYADQEAGACGATGDGDVMMRFLPCYQVVESMRQGMTPKDAAVDAISRIKRKYPDFVGAVFALNVQGVHAGACHGWTFQYSVRSKGMEDVEVYTIHPEDNKY